MINCIHLYISNSIKLYLNSCCYLFIKKSLHVTTKRSIFYESQCRKIGFQNFVLEEVSKMADKRSTNNKLEKLRRKVSLNSQKIRKKDFSIIVIGSKHRSGS